MDEERAREAVTHLQAAMKELLKSARAVLDVAEDLIEDPTVVSAAVDAVREVVSDAAHMARSATGASRPTSDDDGPPIERITVS